MATADVKPIATVSGAQANPEGEMDALLLGRTRELVVSSPNERNWRGIFIALLVIVAVLGLIVFSIVLVSPPEEGSRVKGEKPTLEDIYLKLPEPAKFNGTWISDTEFVYRDIFGGISIYNAENLTTSTFLTNTTFRQYNVVDFRTSRDLKFVLLITDLRHNFDYSTLAQYYILEVSSGYTKPLSPKELDDSAPFLKYATWSTNGTSIAFVHNNDIYYKPKVQKDLVCRITSTGGEDIFNGVPDWIYETEILKTDHTLWFSPDGLYLMYATFNDSKVGEYTYTWYDSGNPKAKYPEVKSIKYPKVESNNPEVTVWIVNLSAPKYLFPVQLKPTSSVENGSYLTSASFYGDHDVALVWLNRRQNVSVILSCRAQNNFNCTDYRPLKLSYLHIKLVLDSYFTERYLGIPSQQFLEYEKADLTKRASNMRGKHFLLIHGTADTTVKPQHSMRLARSLIDYDILFRQLVYPDESHTFSKKGLMHMYKEIDQFFNESFGPSLDDWEENTGFFMQ
nr:inactive dipeptidyl peptidase 10-like [Onthophagus taurus]